MERFAVAVLGVASESVTVTVKLDVPVAVGVPEIFPLVLRVSPSGKVPVVTAKEYGAVPPVAAIVVL
jgi:hypothetical protein